MIDIEHWFKGSRNFQKGKLLYDKYGEDDQLKKLFQRGKNREKQKRLELELRKIQKRSSLEETSARADKRFKEPEKEIPEALKPLIDTRKKLFVIGRNAHSHISYSKSEKERFQYAELILSTWEKIGDLWEKIDYYTQHGKFPDQEPQSEDKTLIKSDQDDIISLYTRLLTIRTYLSKYKQNPEKYKAAKTEGNMIIARINYLYGYKRLTPLQ